MRSAVQVLIGVAVGVALTLAILALRERRGHVAPAGTPVPTLGELAGEVFIVTAGRVNVKLGLVDVYALQQSDALAFAEQRENQAAAESRKLQEQQQREKDGLVLARERLAAAQAADEREWKQSLRYPPSSPAHLPYDGEKHQKALNRARAENQRWITSIAATSSSLARLRTPETLCAALPQGFAHTKTDSEGRFSLMVPRTGTFVVAAATSRAVLGRSESYCWFFTVSLGGADSKKIHLSNDNLTDANAPESLFQTGSPGH
jgi:hypothetical protein